MTPEVLQQLIQSHTLPPVLYLFGGEPFLQQSILQQIEKAVLSPGSEDFNRDLFHGKGVAVDKILETVMTYPVFAERRLVLVKDAQSLTTSDYDALLEYIQNPAPETCLIFSGDKIDSRRKFFQTLKKHDALVEFKALNERQIPGFIRHQLDVSGFSMTGDALSLFVNRVGSSLFEVMIELEKLFLYVGEGRLIDVPDVRAVVSSIRAENIFEIGNAVGCQDAGRALNLGRHLIADGEAPLKILSLLVRHFRQLWKARELQVEERPSNEIARRVGVPPFVVEGLIVQGRRYSRVDFRRAFGLFVEADLAMKSSGSQPEVVLEDLLLKLAGENSRNKKGPR
ncbi:DNA polymerase III subunit delta [Geopsychrobacter electrodiphilus]|uniref:DNA polymerase III subunit delta n=1 Tax=Geopsychrobacter electrodiphilus TaxID=225196 RepID=UPI000374F5C2|nr:DNA polymerase III subunit delta [Geopsychrobacter electrodiphilus]